MNETAQYKLDSDQRALLTRLRALAAASSVYEAYRRDAMIANVLLIPTWHLLRKPFAEALLTFLEAARKQKAATLGSLWPCSRRRGREAYASHSS